MEEIAIKVSNLSKAFKIYKNPFADRLKEKLFFWKAKGYYSEFYALKNINLEIKKGELIGIIGRNGAGKSTLLKILAGICAPTTGKVTVNGSLTAVLALGLGFNPRFTGRENIKVGGCILGMSLAEIKKKEDWIIEFSELGSFIDQPIRSYSTGMQARLSFAVAASVSPDILMIDEALATGDALFVQKSLGRIAEICKTGTTAIFISHNLQQIKTLCERVIMIDQGEVKEDGATIDVTKTYYDQMYQYQEDLANKKSEVAKSFEKGNKDFFGNGDAIIDRVWFTDEHGKDVGTLNTGMKATLNLDYDAKKDLDNVRLIVHIENTLGFMAYGFQSINFFSAKDKALVKNKVQLTQGEGTIKIHFDPFLLHTNDYVISVTMYDENELQKAGADFLEKAIYQKMHIGKFTVVKYYDLNSAFIYENPVTLEVDGNVLDSLEIEH